jgi:hypothetical protein
MAVTVPIVNYLQVAQVCQYLAANDISLDNDEYGGSLNATLNRLLYIVRKQVQNAFNQNPNSSTLNSTGEYLYALCGRYINRANIIIGSGVSTNPIIVSQPANQTITVGSNATFSITATGIGTLTYQWQRNNGSGFSNITGATGNSYTLTNGQLSDNGSTFQCVVNSSTGGSTTSGSASLTVNAATIVAYASAQSTDPYPTISALSDPFVYGYSVNITHNTPVAYTLNSADNNVYFIFKIPAGENIKTTWNNSNLNQGIIPDPEFRAAITFGGFTYYLTRNPYAFDPTQFTTLS